MATSANWTVIFEDKLIIKQTGSDKAGYYIEDDSFWNDPKWSNIWAIQYKDDNLDYNDTVEYRDATPHATWNSAALGDFNSQFISKWEASHLVTVQTEWDDTPGDISTGVLFADEAEKIAFLGPRPTSYTAL
jgi:hypothetical protein|tara:strand:+ start:360 stop:755 length:396 start_codon:yes stop_codon:yes gene_type:complete